MSPTSTQYRFKSSTSHHFMGSYPEGACNLFFNFGANSDMPLLNCSFIDTCVEVDKMIKEKAEVSPDYLAKFKNIPKPTLESYTIDCVPSVFKKAVEKLCFSASDIGFTGQAGVYKKDGLYHSSYSDRLGETCPGEYVVSYEAYPVAHKRGANHATDENAKRTPNASSGDEGEKS